MLSFQCGITSDHLFWPQEGRMQISQGKICKHNLYAKDIHITLVTACSLIFTRHSFIHIDICFYCSIWVFFHSLLENHEHIPEMSPSERIFNSCALHLLSTSPSHLLTFSSYNQRVASLQLRYNVTHITVSVREEAKCCWFIFHSPPNTWLKGLELKLGCTETLKTQTHSRLSYSLISNPLGPSFHTGLTL